MNVKIVFGLLCLLLMVSSAPMQTKPLYVANFENAVFQKDWVVEMQPEKPSTVYVKDNKLILDTKGGVTVWLNRLLKGNIQIEYTRTVLMAGQTNDRLSDLNQFWMATNPRNKNLFTPRVGKFHEYDSLQLYYVGMGGNDNKTTRFRKYDGKGNKRIIKEYSDKEHLLTPGKKYKIKIIVNDGVTSFWIDGKNFFTYTDPLPLKEGYFGFRSLQSRQEISDFKIIQLP